MGDDIEALVPSRVVSDILLDHDSSVDKFLLPQLIFLHHCLPVGPSVVVLLVIFEAAPCKLQLLCNSIAA